MYIEIINFHKQFLFQFHFSFQYELGLIPAISLSAQPAAVTLLRYCTVTSSLLYYNFTSTSIYTECRIVCCNKKAVVT